MVILIKGQVEIGYYIFVIILSYHQTDLILFGSLPGLRIWMIKVYLNLCLPKI